jgi:mannose-6-phosphate isomerase-like protein (cupin superfamily)|tara:strand:+ start:483 stop:884 length:402 start_codon:yes stop_codon:yes gene_type:complete
MKALTNNVKGRPMKYSPINLTDKFSKFNEQWQPKVIAEMNDYQFKIARIEGEFVWHNHPDTDETFIIIEGTLDLEFRDGKVTLSAGEMFVVPKGVEHKPVANSECKIMMIEPRGTKNTGDIESNLTAENDVWV